MQYDEHVETNLVSYRFILCGWEAIIYNKHNICVVNCKLYYNYKETRHYRQRFWIFNMKPFL